MDFTNFLQNKQSFTQTIKDALTQRAYSELESLKKEMANDFLNKEQD